MIKMIVDDYDMRPIVGTEGSAGYDLKICHDVQIAPGHVVKVGSGVKVEIPEGYVGIVTPRSSSKGIVLQNVVGIIDSDYQGEIMFKLLNTTNETYLGYRGDRMMQMVIVPYFMEKIMYVQKFDKKTNRGEEGFGSTGSAEELK